MQSLGQRRMLHDASHRGRLYRACTFQLRRTGACAAAARADGGGSVAARPRQSSRAERREVDGELPAFSAGGDIPFENTQYRGNVFPGLAWSAGPAGTKSYAVIMQDPDALRNGAPILHWTMVNIPASETKLAAGMSAPPAGRSTVRTFGARTRRTLGRARRPARSIATTFRSSPSTRRFPPRRSSYADLIGAMKEHVLASGEVIGLGQVAPSTGK